MNYVDKIKKESNNAIDYLYKEIKLNNNTINLIRQCRCDNSFR